MFTAYVAVTALAAAMNAWSALADVRRSRFSVASSDAVGLERSWIVPFGLLKAAGALGLLAGIAFSPLGIAAAIGLTLYFLGAVVLHLRHRLFRTLAFPGIFLVAALAALTLALAV